MAFADRAAPYCSRVMGAWRRWHPIIVRAATVALAIPQLNANCAVVQPPINLAAEGVQLPDRVAGGSGFAASILMSRRANLRFDATKGKATSGSHREGESTEAERRGGAARRSDEGPVMGWSEGAARRRCVPIVHRLNRQRSRLAIPVERAHGYAADPLVGHHGVDLGRPRRRRVRRADQLRDRARDGRLVGLSKRT